MVLDTKAKAEDVARIKSLQESEEKEVKEPAE
jgi:hypothetical protein